jgi:uncharacterized protein with HEPN domain
MKRDALLYIEDMLESIGIIEEYTRNLSESHFLESRQVQDAVIRRLEIMGEAAKNVPQVLRDEYSDVPWKRIAGLRDVLIHAYFGVQLHRTWKVVREDLPELKVQPARVRDHLIEDKAQ